jgi:hypothetical protein
MIWPCSISTVLVGEAPMFRAPGFDHKNNYSTGILTEVGLSCRRAIEEGKNAAPKGQGCNYIRAASASRFRVLCSGTGHLGARKAQAPPARVERTRLCRCPSRVAGSQSPHDRRRRRLHKRVQRVCHHGPGQHGETRPRRDQGIVYANDRQVKHLQVEWCDIAGSYIVRFMSLVVATGLSAGREFLWVRVSANAPRRDLIR